jgi:hypothetical protein
MSVHLNLSPNRLYIIRLTLTTQAPADQEFEERFTLERPEERFVVVY